MTQLASRVDGNVSRLDLPRFGQSDCGWSGHLGSATFLVGAVYLRVNRTIAFFSSSFDSFLVRPFFFADAVVASRRRGRII
jgi:hypothetical protein